VDLFVGGTFQTVLNLILLVPFATSAWFLTKGIIKIDD
jgi:hypothetical protein